MKWPSFKSLSAHGPPTLNVLPPGYLAYGQSAAYKIKMDLPQSHGESHDHFYETFIMWLEGKDIEAMKVELGV